jgi:serine/threonine-protein kinase CLA4
MYSNYASSNYTPSRPAPAPPTSTSLSPDSPYSASSLRQVAPATNGFGFLNPTTIIKRGWISIKEDGIRSFIWAKKWVILKEQVMSIYKNEVGNQTLQYVASHLVCS